MAQTDPDHDVPTLDDVLDPTEHATPDHREHAKTPKHLNDDDLQRRAELERDGAGTDDAGDSAVSAVDG